MTGGIVIVTKRKTSRRGDRGAEREAALPESNKGIIWHVPVAKQFICNFLKHTVQLQLVIRIIIHYLFESYCSRQLASLSETQNQHIMCVDINTFLNSSYLFLSLLTGTKMPMLARPQEYRQLPLITVVLKVSQLLSNIRVLTHCMCGCTIMCAKHWQKNNMVNKCLHVVLNIQQCLC